MKLCDLTYDPESGVVSWTEDGRVAGYIHSSGYRYIGVDGKMLLAHRLAFELMGLPAPLEVDHINGDKADNRWINLRPATRGQNVANSRKQSGSLPYAKGVYFDKSRGKFLAQICCDGKRRSLGRYSTEQEAHAAYAAAAKLHFGEFARTT